MNYIKVYLNSPFSLVLTPFFAVGLIVKEQEKIRIEIENANLMYLVRLLICEKKNWHIVTLGVQRAELIRKWIRPVCVHTQKNDLMKKEYEMNNVQNAIPASYKTTTTAQKLYVLLRFMP